MADTGPSDLRPNSNVYTVLVIVATIFLLAATVFTSMRAQALYGNWMPF
ncbi:MAG TPA: hypothetical protein PKN33_08380 [Phycisphaerae bacterium]|nr:hypothetical protein [Phycisphaerales bacterium]HNO78064.1 hypothetical protein [Phycisphaerae bacterium]